MDGLSNVALEISFVGAQSNRRKNQKNSELRGSAEGHHRGAEWAIASNRSDGVPGVVAQSRHFDSYGAAAALGVLQIIPRWIECASSGAASAANVAPWKGSIPERSA
jgi:hypothetical protein